MNVASAITTLLLALVLGLFLLLHVDTRSTVSRQQEIIRELESELIRSTEVGAQLNKECRALLQDYRALRRQTQP